MLALNSLSENTRGHDIKPKAKADTVQDGSNDFQSYLSAYIAPAKYEPTSKPTESSTARTADFAPNAAAAPDIYKAENKPITTDTAQKAGHGKTDDEVSQKAASQTEAPREKTAASGTKDDKRSVEARQHKELLETLGLAAKKSPHQIAAVVKKGPAAEEAIKTGAKAAVNSVANKTASAIGALGILRQTPESILTNTEGLRRLSEKLGAGFLAKMSDKLVSKNEKTEAVNTQSATTASRQSNVTTTVTHAQKAGDGSTEQNANLHKHARSARQSVAANVSRETLLPQTADKEQISGIAGLKPPIAPETVLNQNNTRPDFALRLSDAVTSTQAPEHIRGAVENPLLRGEMVRQFNEIMGRAQVLVADSQNAQFTVKLNPRELGRMEIDLKLIDGEIKGKIVVESEEVKSEMQNFLDNHENQSADQQMDLNRIDIEVRSGSQNAQNFERTPDADTLMQNLVTQNTSSFYENTDSAHSGGAALYA